MNIKVGYYNWNDFGLKDSFYPHDMPAEWRLVFYANEIECAQISLDSLRHSKDAEALFEGLNEQFHLMVYCDDKHQWLLIDKLLKNDEITIKTLLTNELSRKQWSESLAKYAIPCFVKDNEQELWFDNNVVGRQLLKNKLNIAYLDALLNLKQIRIFIEQWAEDEQLEYYILLNPSVYKSSLAGEIRLMIEIMGY